MDGFKTEEDKTRPQEEKSGDARRCGEALSLVSKRRRGTHGNGYLLSLPGLSLSLSFPLPTGAPPQASLLPLSLSPSFSRPLLCRLTIIPGKRSLSRAPPPKGKESNRNAVFWDREDRFHNFLDHVLPSNVLYHRVVRIFFQRKCVSLNFISRHINSFLLFFSNEKEKFVETILERSSALHIQLEFLRIPIARVRNVHSKHLKNLPPPPPSRIASSNNHPIVRNRINPQVSRANCGRLGSKKRKKERKKKERKEEKSIL